MPVNKKGKFILCSALVGVRALAVVVSYDQQLKRWELARILTYAAQSKSVLYSCPALFYIIIINIPLVLFNILI